MQKFTEEQEKQITEQLAKIFRFKTRENDVKCLICGKRLTYKAIGLINERMINHANRHKGITS